MITERQLRHIVAQAMPLRERLQQSQDTHDNLGDETAAQRWQTTWQNTLGGDGLDPLQRRLEWSGYHLSRAQQILGATAAENLVEELPSWSLVLQDALRYFQDRVETPNFSDWIHAQPFVRPDASLPYQELFIPLVAWGMSRLENVCSEAQEHLHSQAWAAIGRSLLTSLTDQSKSCLDLEFSLYRVKTQSPLSRFQRQTAARQSDTLYQQFIAKLTSGQFLEFLGEYAVLARHIGLTLERWLITTQEFLSRLTQDWQRIHTTFWPDQASPSVVVSLETNLSDPHHGGRTVYSLRFSTDRRLIYKPKDVGVEAAYFDLLHWLNPHLSLAFKTLRVLALPGYGWVEAAEHLACRDEEAAHRYYRRAGMLLCLLYALEATDCLYENIVASGEHPVLIDLETLMHPRYQREYFADLGEMVKTQQFGQELLKNSVMRTGLLPNWYVGRDGAAYIGSGLGMVTEQATGHQRVSTRHVNTDRMENYFQEVRLDPGKSAPYLGERPLALPTYTDDVVCGFREMYQLLLEKRSLFLEGVTPLVELGRQRVRFLHRNTRDYAVSLSVANQPKFLRQGVDHSLVFEKLFKPYLRLAQKPQSWPVAEAELFDLERGDIPHFTTIASSRDLEMPNGELLPRYFAVSAYEKMRQRLEALSPADEEMQVGFIRAAIASYAIPKQQAVELLGGRETAVEFATTPLSAEDLVAEAKDIAAGIMEKALLLPNGEATWVVMGYDLHSDYYQLQPIGYDIYNGRCGIALFFAALAATTGDEDAHKFARATIQPILKQLETPSGRKSLSSAMNLGGLTGLGAIVYTLTRVGRWLDDPAILQSAAVAVDLISPERIQRDTEYDMIYGVAGTLLAFLALHEQTNTDSLLQQARACGDYLLSTRTPNPAGQRVWRNKTGQYATGFSHGAAGAAYSLLRLYGATNDPVYRDAAAEAIAFEQMLFDSERGNWPDFGWGEPPRFMLTWCHGAPGIGLGRVGGMEYLTNEAIEHDLRTALHATQNVGVTPIDHLCCGNFGRFELYLEADRLLQNATWGHLARTQASAIIQRKRRDGYYGIFPSDNMLGNTFAPSFFRGTSGIGYALLRLAFPEQLPSILQMR